MVAHVAAGRTRGPGVADVHHRHGRPRFGANVRLYLTAEWLTGLTIDGGMYAVVFNLYLSRLGYDLGFIGSINGLGLLIYGLGSVPAGLMGRRWGNRQMLALGMSIIAIGSGFLPFAEFAPSTWQTNWLLITYCIVFSGLALYTANSAPFLMDTTSKSTRSFVFASASGTWFLAGLVGNALGGWIPTALAQSPHTFSLDRPAPYRYTLWIAALLVTPAVIALSRTSPSHHRPPAKQDAESRGPVPLRLIGVLALVRLLQVAGIACVFIFLNVYLDDGLGIATTGIGTIFAFGRLGGLVLILGVPVLAARLGNRRLIIWTTTGIGVGLLPLGLVPHWGAAAFSYTTVLALTAIRLPAFLVYTMEAVPPSWRTTMSGASETANGLGFAAIGLGGGHMMAAFGYRPLVLVSACLVLAGTLIFGRTTRTGPASSPLPRRS